RILTRMQAVDFCPQFGDTVLVGVQHQLVLAAHHRGDVRSHQQGNEGDDIGGAETSEDRVEQGRANARRRGPWWTSPEWACRCRAGLGTPTHYRNSRKR